MHRSIFIRLALATACALPLFARTALAQDFLYVGDLKTGTLLRYSATMVNGSLEFAPFGINGNTTDPAYIANDGVTEGVHGTGNTLITSQITGGSFRLSRFDRVTGSFVNFVTPQTFGGIGNLALTNDAKYAYVPDESASRLYRVDVATGTVISTPMSGVHDVQIGPDGNIYATAYSANSGVRMYKPDFSEFSPGVNFVQVVAPGANGLTRPAGVVVSGNTLYVAQNKVSITSQVLKYTLNGDAPATFVGEVTSDLLSFTFGMEMGQDNNLYVAIPGTFYQNAGPNQIVKIDLSLPFGTSSAVSQAILYPGTANEGTYNTNANPSDDQVNVIWPKYIKFSSNFAQANDPGFVVIPESGSIALLLAGGAPLAGIVAIRRRKKTA